MTRLSHKRSYSLHGAATPARMHRPDAARVFGSASAYTAQFYNDGTILDQPLMAPDAYAPIAATAVRILEAHGALDVAEMLGLTADVQVA